MLHVVSKGTDASNGKQGRNLMLFADIFVANLQGVISAGPKIYALFTTMHKCDPYHEKWIWLDNEKGVKFSSYVSGKDKLTMCGISNTDKLCDDCVGGSNSGVKNEGGESHLKTVTSFAKFMLLTKPLNHSLVHTALAGATNTVNV